VGRSLTSREAILAATRRAIVERGPGRLTLSVIAASAGVSRPTLYRWFPTKDDLLAAIAVYEEEQFDLGLRAVIGAHRSPARRLDAALRYLVTYLDGSMGPDPIGADPQFALRSLARSLPVQREAIERLLGDALGQVPAVSRGELSSQQAAELFLRLAYSHYLIPHADPEALLANLRSLAGLAGRPSPSTRTRRRSLEKVGAAVAIELGA
jgi:AcrR family transcriptional regulator